MRTTLKYLLYCLLIAAAVAGLSACSDDDKDKDEDKGASTYNEVVATYPSDATLCQTELTISETADGALSMSGAMSTDDQGNNIYKCYGTRITIGDGAVTLDEHEYAAGTKLTVDKDLEWVEVSSWE